jgi:hypothetical protein
MSFLSYWFPNWGSRLTDVRVTTILTIRLSCFRTRSCVAGHKCGEIPLVPQFTILAVLHTKLELFVLKLSLVTESARCSGMVSLLRPVKSPRRRLHSRPLGVQWASWRFFANNTLVIPLTVNFDSSHSFSPMLSYSWIFWRGAELPSLTCCHDHGLLQRDSLPKTVRIFNQLHEEMRRRSAVTAA